MPNKQSRKKHNKLPKRFRENGGPGRPKGSKNKFTDLKNAFLDAFEKTGGVDGLVKWIKRNPRTRGQFYQMIARMLPTNLDVKLPQEMTVIVSDKYAPKVKK